jgi:phosphotransferase system IIA component
MVRHPFNEEHFPLHVLIHVGLDVEALHGTEVEALAHLGPHVVPMTADLLVEEAEEGTQQVAEHLAIGVTAAHPFLLREVFELLPHTAGSPDS